MGVDVGVLRLRYHGGLRLLQVVHGQSEEVVLHEGRLLPRGRVVERGHGVGTSLFLLGESRGGSEPRENYVYLTR